MSLDHVRRASQRGAHHHIIIFSGHGGIETEPYVHDRQYTSLDGDLPGVRSDYPAQYAHQRRLSGTLLSDYADLLSFHDLERNLFQDRFLDADISFQQKELDLLHVVFILPVCLADIFYLDGNFSFAHALHLTGSQEYASPSACTAGL